MNLVRRFLNIVNVFPAEPPAPPPPERLPSDHGLHVTNVQINRAPVLTLWVAEVAKRQGCAPHALTSTLTLSFTLTLTQTTTGQQKRLCPARPVSEQSRDEGSSHLPGCDAPHDWRACALARD